MNKNFRFVLTILFGLMIICTMESIKRKKTKTHSHKKKNKQKIKTKIYKSSNIVMDEINKMKKFILGNNIKSNSKAIRILERAQKMLE